MKFAVAWVCSRVVSDPFHYFPHDLTLVMRILLFFLVTWKRICCFFLLELYCSLLFQSEWWVKKYRCVGILFFLIPSALEKGRKMSRSSIQGFTLDIHLGSSIRRYFLVCCSFVNTESVEWNQPYYFYFFTNQTIGSVQKIYWNFFSGEISQKWDNVQWRSESRQVVS